MLYRRASNLIKDALAARGYSQRELARRMGRPYQAINEMVNGKKRVTATTAIYLERVLGIKASVLLSAVYDEELEQARSKVVEERAASLQLPLFPMEGRPV